MNTKYIGRFYSKINGGIELEVNISSDEVKQEGTTPEFRKCWSLGEAFYYVKAYFEGISIQDYYYTKTRLEAIHNISKNLGLEDEKIYAIVEELRGKLPKDKPSQIDETTKNTLSDLESYLKAGLTGKEPEFMYIFSTANDCQTLYFKGKQSDDFLDNLYKFKNFISYDKVILITEVVNYWKPIKTKERNFPPEVKSRIAGLILGTIDISDILTRTDRFKWVLVCYILVVVALIFVGIIIVAILLWVYQTYGEFLSGLFTKLSTPEDVSNKESPLASISSLAASILPVLGSAIVVWQRSAKTYERCLAKNRLTKGLNKSKKDKSGKKDKKS